MVPASFQILSNPSFAIVQPSMLRGVSMMEVHKLKEMINQLIWIKNFYINLCSLCDSYSVMAVCTTLQQL